VAEAQPGQSDGDRPLLTISAYAGSKHWIEAYTDTLATEMEPHGVSVSVVEPGNCKSNIRRTSVAREHKQAKATGTEITDEMKQDYEQTAERELSYKEPDGVSDAFMHALFDDSALLVECPERHGPDHGE